MTQSDKKLPIDAFRGAIVEAVRGNQVVVIAAETGAGKSTRVPLMLLEAGLGKKGLIGITQPRRIAAISVSEYVAELHGSRLGETIGYQIRHDKAVSRQTRVKFMTEGILLRELHADPELKRYEIVVIDEAHERGVNQDLILALLQKVRRARPEIKIVIMSATIDESRFSEYFDRAPIIKVPGRVFPVEVRYENDTPFGDRAVAKACIDKVEEILGSHEAGDILVFLPEEKMIRRVCSELEDLHRKIRVLPLFGNQAPEEQRQVFVQNGVRRVIVATNIAETSVTVDGVVHVIDSGLIKGMQYVSAAMSALRVMEHSKAGCDQRKGRAGRTRPGICHRLFSKQDFEDRSAFTEPEIKRMALDQILLHLRVLDYSMEEILGLEFIDPPESDRWREAEERLKTFGALNAADEVTDEGRLMERLPVAPMLGRMLLTARKFNCIEELTVVVAGLTSRPVFVRPKGKELEADRAHATFRDLTSDALTLIRVWDSWTDAVQAGGEFAWARENFLSSRALKEIERNVDQLLTILEAEGFEITSSNDHLLIRKAVAAGAIVNLCVNSGDNSYNWGDRHDIYIYPGSGLFKALPRMFVCASIVESSKAFARDCTAIEPAWLVEILPPECLKLRYELKQSFLGTGWYLAETLTYNGMVLSERRVETISESALADIVGRIAKDVTTGWGYGDFHPQTKLVRSMLQAVMHVLNVDWYLFATDVDLVKRLVLHIASRVRGATTLEEVMSRDISINAADWLTSGQLDAFGEFVAAEQARAEEQARIDQSYALRQQAEQSERQVLTDRAKALGARARALQGDEARETATRISRLEYRIGWSRSADILAELEAEEIKIQRLEEVQSERFALTETIWKTVLERFPVCPLCGADWQTSGNMLLMCFATHDTSRLISHDREMRTPAEFTLGEFRTDRDDVCATLKSARGTVSLHFSLPRNHPWQGKKWKEVKYAPKAAILPSGLAGLREDILRDLSELDKSFAETAQLELKTAEYGREHGASKVKTLKFKTVGGISVADDGGVRYQAAFQDSYPGEGETWICRLGKEIPNGRRTIEVFALCKVGSVSSIDDLEVLRGILRETYAGIPEELLS